MNYKIQELPLFEDVKKIFFIGIKGVGVAPLALIASGAGIKIAGSDVPQEFITDVYLKQKKINIFEGFELKDIKAFFDSTAPSESLVITTGAHKGFDNPQAVYAREQGISVLSQGQALSLFMEGEIIGRQLRGVSIAGSHGKTTITSLLSTTAKAMGLDPSYAIGTGEVFPLGAPGHLGRGELFIAEADEYVSEPAHDKVPKFLYQRPFYAVFNNVDFDHPDVFKSIEEVEEAFVEFAHNIQSNGLLLINGDDAILSKFPGKIKKDIRIVTYGAETKNDYVVSKVVVHPSSTMFTVSKKGREIGVFVTGLVGRHNAVNALSVISLLLEMGYSASQIKPCLKVFEGSKRRMEVRGIMSGGAVVIDDYGHHPLEISTTVSAVKASHPGKKVIAVFQPHTYSRTKALLAEFTRSFAGAEEVVLMPVFKSARDTETDTISDDEIVTAFNKNVPTKYLKTHSDVVEYLRKNYTESGYVILTIGAGDVYLIAEELTGHK